MDEKVVSEVLFHTLMAEEAGALKNLGGLDGLLGLSEKLFEMRCELEALCERKSHLSADMEENWREVDKLKESIKKLKEKISDERHELNKKCLALAVEVVKYSAAKN